MQPTGNIHRHPLVLQKVWIGPQINLPPCLAQHTPQHAADAHCGGRAARTPWPCNCITLQSACHRLHCALRLPTHLHFVAFACFLLRLYTRRVYVCAACSCALLAVLCLLLYFNFGSWLLRSGVVCCVLGLGFLCFSLLFFSAFGRHATETETREGRVKNCV